MAWDWFLGWGLVFAAQAFPPTGQERIIRRALLLSGLLALAGIVGPVVGDIRLQRIGIFGYALVLPVACLLLSRFFLIQSASLN